MALFECKKKSSTIGNIYAEVGDVTLSSSTTTKVTLGWQPDEVMIMSMTQPFSSTSAGSLQFTVLTTLKDNSKIIQISSDGTPSKISLPGASNNSLYSIDSDGFTINKDNGTRKYCRYIAYKFKD